MTAALALVPGVEHLTGYEEGDQVTASELADLLEASARALLQRGEPEKAAACWSMVARLADSIGQHADALGGARRAMQPTPRPWEPPELEDYGDLDFGDDF